MVFIKGLICSVITVTQFLLVMGCEGLPTVTRSGKVKEFFFRGNLSPLELTVHDGDEIRWVNQRAELRVHVGDEVRWVNQRMAPIRIVFLDPVQDKVSCLSNFNGRFNNEATLGPNESASLCFREPTYSKYVVLVKSAAEAGEPRRTGAVLAGAVQVSVSH